jgi:hypothetical protein
MIGHEISISSGDDVVRLVRALGQHRYVAGRGHELHALAIDAARGDPALAEAVQWADGVLSDPSIEVASRDERLRRRSTDAELVAVVAAFFGGDRPGVARLRERLASFELDPDEGGREAWDESGEDDVFPLLVDAGWELLQLRELDPERHKGAMNAFGDQLAWDVAKFEEENDDPPTVHLHELPALGPAELLADVPESFVLWASGNETYLDYVMRGVLKVAKISND